MSKNVYLYGIVSASDTLEIKSRGVTGSAPFIIPVKNVGIIASYYNDEKIEIDINTLSRHDEVIGELMEKHCVLPIPIRSIMRDSSDAVRFVSENYNKICGNIENLYGKWEMGLRLAWDTKKVYEEIRNECDVIPQALNGETKAKSYLLGMRSKYNWEQKVKNRAERIRDGIIGPLSTVFARHKDTLLSSENIPVSSVFLIEHHEKDLFIEEIEKQRAENTDVHFLVSGPWAPYNFVEFTKGAC